MPLTMLKAGESAVVTEVRGGHGMRRRLTSMGIVPGTSVRMVSGSEGGGPIIISVGAGRFGLGRGMAHHVLVELSESKPA